MTTMPNINITQTLQDFGLSTAEISVYLSSLELGPQPASVIARKAGLKRGHTYNILTLLIGKGIMQEFTENDIRYFTSRPPNTLITILDHKHEQIEHQKRKLLQAIPLLNTIQNPMINQPKVRFFQGVEGIKEIYEDGMRVPSSNIYAVGDFNFFFPKEKDSELHEWIWNYATRRAENDVWFIGIVNKSEYSDKAYRRRKEQKRKMKMLTDVFLPVELYIYQDKVALMSTAEDMIGLIIEDAPIAETLRNFHQAVWKYLPDYTLATSSKQ